MGRVWDLVSGKVARESKERFEQAQQIVEDAKARYDRTVERFEAASQQARVIADAYGKYRLECLTSDIRGYRHREFFALRIYASGLKHG